MVIEIRRTGLAAAHAVIHYITDNEARKETLAGKAEILAVRTAAVSVIAVALVIVAVSVVAVTLVVAVTSVVAATLVVAVTLVVVATSVVAVTLVVVAALVIAAVRSWRCGDRSSGIAAALVIDRAVDRTGRWRQWRPRWQSQRIERLRKPQRWCFRRWFRWLQWIERTFQQ